MSTEEILKETPADPPEPDSLRPVEKAWGRGQDALAAGCLAVLCFIVLFLTAGSYGITWDEAAPNFVAARNQAEWFRQLSSLESPFSGETIDEYWHSPSTHPSLTRTLMAFSLLGFESLLGEVRAMRLPSVILASLLVGVLYFWLSRRLNCVIALGTVAAWVTLPRVFGHLHIASLDVPMLVWWALTVITFYEGARRPMLSGWHVLTGLLYGLALSTKLHSFFLPIPLVAWMLIHRKWTAWRALAAMAVLGPIIYLATQVYLWPDFWPRLMERFITYSNKDAVAPVRILYFGQQITERTPWHYPIMMSLVTTPAVTLFFLILGAIGLHRVPPESRLRSLILLNIGVPAALVTLPHAQGYDGVRLILPAFPWLSILAGLGLDRLVHFVRAVLTRQQGRTGKILFAGCFLVMFLPNLIALTRTAPFHLEYYADWIGGIPGGQRLRMESTYWCDALQPELLQVLNQKIPEGASLRPLAMSYDVLHAYQRLGSLRKDIVIGGDPPYDYHLLQCRQGFYGRTEWAFYGGRFGLPLATVSHRSVPFFLFFGPLPIQSGAP